MTVGERIKSLREKMGISQVDFADKIGVSKQTLYKYENNIITNIPSDKIELAAKLCNVQPAFLMGWEVPEHSVEYSSTFEDYPERVGISHSILKKFKIDVEQLVIEDLKTARTLIEKRIDLYYEDIEQQQDEIEADLALEEQRDASDFELPAGWKR